MIKIKRNDDVKVISGNYNGETGRVIKVLRSKNRVIVECINNVKNHVMPTQDNPQGGIIEKEMSIHFSNYAALIVFFILFSKYFSI